MMNSTRQRTLTTAFLCCAILYTGIVYNRVKSKVVPPTEKAALAQRPLNYGEQQRINSALEKMIAYAHDIGTWLEDLFDEENNVSYVEHVEKLKGTLSAIKQDFAHPSLSDDNTHPTLKATHQVALLLAHKVENTYEVLQSYCGGSYLLGHVRLGMALKKVLNSSTDKAEFDMALQNLHAQLEVLAPELNAKLNDVKGTIKLYSERINNRHWHTLKNGLSHRLACKEQA
jgi:hypothetical protein